MARLIQLYPKLLARCGRCEQVAQQQTAQFPHPVCELCHQFHSYQYFQTVPQLCYAVPATSQLGKALFHATPATHINVDRF